MIFMLSGTIGTGSLDGSNLVYVFDLIRNIAGKDFLNETYSKSPAKYVSLPDFCKYPKYEFYPAQSQEEENEKKCSQRIHSQVGHQQVVKYSSICKS
jgi:hypothetical protein